MEDEYFKKINTLELCKELKMIRTIYQKLEQKQKVFCDTFTIHCMKGCGKCCEHFIPDISQVESDFLAFGLISEGIHEYVLKVLDNNCNNADGCPLFDKDNDYHCTVYKWRPLVCRLFGASASQNKEGKPVFRNCKFNSCNQEITTKILEEHKKAIVKMGDFGQMVENIRVDESKRMLLPEALKASINKILYMLELEAEANKEY